MRTGFCVRRASMASSVSRSMILPPKPPPTGIGITFTLCRGTSTILATWSRRLNGPWVGDQMVRPPSGSGRTIETCGSSDVWWTPATEYVPLTTTSDDARAAAASPRFMAATPLTFFGLGTVADSELLAAP